VAETAVGYCTNTAAPAPTQNQQNHQYLSAKEISVFCLPP
jgi:hypothetical protein